MCDLVARSTVGIVFAKAFAAKPLIVSFRHTISGTLRFFASGSTEFVCFLHGGRQAFGCPSPALSSCTKSLAQAAGSAASWRRRTRADPTIAASACWVTASTWLADPMPKPQATGSWVKLRNSATLASTSGAWSLSPVMVQSPRKWSKPGRKPASLAAGRPACWRDAAAAALARHRLDLPGGGERGQAGASGGWAVK